MTCVKSSVEVYLRFLGQEHSERFETLTREMKFFYNDIFPSESVTQPLVGKLYAACVGGTWDRVLVEKIIVEGFI